MKNEKKITEAAKAILDSEYVIALTGAGISTESGIPDFRGPSGIWTRLGEPSSMQFREFLADPTKWVSKLLESPLAKELISKFSAAKPNPGHLALAELERMGILKSLITQNIDNLHQLAGSERVIEFHGNVYKTRCLRCGKRYELDKLGGKCECGGFIKPDAVFFGEPIPEDVLARAFEEARKCDCMIVAGTSASVYPASSLPVIAKTKEEFLGLRIDFPFREKEGAKIIEVNEEETSLTHTISDYFLGGKTGEILPAIVAEVKRLK